MKTGNYISAILSSKKASELSWGRPTRIQKAKGAGAAGGL